MSRVLSGTPVPRHQVFVLDDGNPVVQWSESRVQEIYSGRVRPFDYSQFGHPVNDYELDHLKSLGLVEYFTRQYVWVFALPEQSQFIGLRTIEGTSQHSRMFYLNTTLPDSQLGDVVVALEAAGAGEQFTAQAYEGMVAVLGPESTAYATVDEAEAAQQTLVAVSPLFEHTTVVFTDVPPETHTDDAETLDLDALIASQSATPVTEGRHVLVVCREDERHSVESALHEMHIETQTADNGTDALYLLEESAANDAIPDLLIMDVHLSDMHGWEMLSRMREIHPLNTLPVILIGEDADDDLTMALTVAGVQAYLNRPLNTALLRQHVYEALKGSAVDK